MRIRAERDDLADVLSRAARAVGTRSPLPILQGLLVEVAGKTMRVIGTDLEVTVRTELEVEVMEEGRAVIPARLATDAVRDRLENLEQAQQERYQELDEELNQPSSASSEARDEEEP